MVRTRVGYAGGVSQHPTYYDLGGHSETIQIDYDPKVISYEELLDVFWNSHDPAAKPWSSQYLSIIFYHDEEQRRIATESLEREEARPGTEVLTSITPFTAFYRAEDYHQKYYLRQESVLMRDLQRFYPGALDFTDSTAAARLNGYAGGFGDIETLLESMDDLALSEEGRSRLLEIAAAGLRPACPLTSSQ